MDELATDLGMSKKTLYAHFTNKTALVEAVVEAKLSEADSTLSAVGGESAADVGKALHELIATLQREVAEVQPAFVRDLQREAPQIFEFIQSRRKAMIQQHFGRLLTAGQKAGLIRRDIRVPLMIEILLGMVQSLVNPAKLNELQLEPKAAIGCVLKVFLEGVLK